MSSLEHLADPPRDELRLWGSSPRVRVRGRPGAAPAAARRVVRRHRHAAALAETPEPVQSGWFAVLECVDAGEATYERLAYEAAQRALDKQERLLEELRSRTGLLLAAASLAASFLGREAFDRDPKRGLALLAVVTFLLAVGASVYILLPKRDKFVFALVGAGLYEGLYAVRQDLGEVYRRLAYDLDRFWDDNDAELQKLFTSFRVAAAALSAEILVLIAMVSDNLF